MIYHLQKKFIRICGTSVLIVFTVIFLLIYSVSQRQLDDTMDELTDQISDNDGSFPEWTDGSGNQKIPEDVPGFMTVETPFRTRFFTVRFDGAGQVSEVNVSSISAVTEEAARELGMETYKDGRKRGWSGNYRYKRYLTEHGTAIVYVDSSMDRFMSGQQILGAGCVLVISALAIMLIVVFFSKRAVRPVAESYAKQRQFVTDASHELRTPLALMMANLYILETEIGENEWLSGIRSEGRRMEVLVNQLVVLARMDENRTALEMRHFSMSGMVADAVSEFQILAQERGKSLLAQVEQDVYYTGDLESVRRVFSILLENAVKYCDEGGTIVLRLEKGKHPVLFVENTYADAGITELGMLFDRFYRSDKARTFNGGFGVGLSIAKSIVTQHKGEISAYRKDGGTIGFKTVWK